MALAPNARLAVRFLSRWQSYYAGDVATFPARLAAILVARGRAERVNIASDPNPPEGAVFAVRPAATVIKTRPSDDDLDIL